MNIEYPVLCSAVAEHGLKRWASRFERVD